VTRDAPAEQLAPQPQPADLATVEPNASAAGVTAPTPPESGATEPAAPERPSSPPPLPQTGVTAVDAAADRLQAVDDAPLEDHVEIYEDVHRRLQEGLADLDEQ